MRLKQIVDSLRLPGSASLIASLVAKGDCQTALDIGCGQFSVLTAHRPKIRTFGLDASPEALEVSRHAKAHDVYLLADILRTPLEKIMENNGGTRFDMVTMFDVVEHVPKRLGFELLEQCEKLTGKYIVVGTPNGFLEQGPEFGNEYQRHLSGWFSHDFQGLGYTVYGVGGMKAFHGYAGTYRWPLPGIKWMDLGLSRLLHIWSNRRLAFGLLAVKDVRGVPARLPTGNKG